MACLGFVTFLPLRPDFSFPSFMARISRSTSLPAEGEYLRPDDFLELDFFALDFFPLELRVLFFALLPREERLLLRDERDDLLFELLDFFFAAFLVAITILLAGQMAPVFRQVVCSVRAQVASRSGCSEGSSALNYAANSWQPNKWIGDEPCGNACERPGHSELQNWRRNPRMKQQAQSHEYRRMKNVDSVSAAIEP